MLNCPKCKGVNIYYWESDCNISGKKYKVNMQGEIRWDTVEYTGMETVKVAREMICEDCGKVVSKIK